MRLFIDTNILLSFFHLTSEDIEELKKLVALIEGNQIELILTDQVLDEFYRNRESKISDAMKKLKEIRFSLNFPAFCKDYPEYDDLRALLGEANKKHSELISSATEDAERRSLKADEIVEGLFSKAKILPCDDHMILLAQKRVQIGNPPGKRGSLGDALNWECLLRECASTDELCFVSGDSDYASPLAVSALHDFLAREWSKTCRSELSFYRKISEFFRARYPSIKLASEVEKDLLIRDLAVSGSFARTHQAIAQLMKHQKFNTPQIEQLVSIPEYNRQVGWITGDPDVQAFYRAIFDNHSDELPNGLSHKLRDLLERVENYDDDDEIPF